MCEQDDLVDVLCDERVYRLLDDSGEGVDVGAVVGLDRDAAGAGEPGEVGCGRADDANALAIDSDYGTGGESARDL